jgi:hypothetical protein
VEPLAPAAPAPPAAAPDTISASIDAVNRNDFDAFDRAELGKRTGKPVADVEAPEPADTDAPPATAAPGTPPRQLSKRQQQLNDSIREAVERATAPLTAELAQLKAVKPPAAAPAPPVAAAPPAKTTPEYKRIMALEGAPKLADFDSVEEHAFAAAEFIDSTRTKERETAARTSASRDAFVASEKAVDDAFFEQLEKAKTADPEFTKNVAPEVLALTPLEWLPRDKDGRALDETGRPLTTGPQHVVASELRKSPVVRELMLHFSQQPADLARLVAGPPQLAAIPVERRTPAQLFQHIRWIEHEMKRLEGRLAGAGAPADSTAAPAAPAVAPVSRSPITAAPPPPPTLRAAGSTSDAKAAALARDDFAEFDRLETQGRLAKLSPR